MRRASLLAAVLGASLWGPLPEPCRAKVLPVPVTPGTPEVEATPQQQAYWWQDELRTAAFALSKARIGKVSQWPRMLVSAGSATMPLPTTSGAIRCDGKLDEAAWSEATVFPVGPIFGPWRQGPFVLKVRACRDARTAYVAVETPCDVKGLGSLQSGELFQAAGRPYRVSTEGKVPGGACARKDGGWVIELSVPLGGGKPVAVTFFPEVVRRGGGKLPPELTYLGIDRLGARRSRRGGTLWLTPIAVKLVPAGVSAQLTWTVDGPRQVTLSHRLSGEKSKPQVGKTALKPKGGPGFFPYVWQAPGKTQFRAEGFFYVEPIRETLDAAAAMAARGRKASTNPPETDVGAAILTAEIWLTKRELVRATPSDRPAWRARYCWARTLRAKAHLALLDAPMLFVKRHPYFAAHIYDEYYPWRWNPGGGIYLLTNPVAPGAGAKVRPVIDPQTKVTLGGGIYRDPEVHWDAKKVLFAHKGTANGNTSIYEIDLDGTGLRRLTNPDKDMAEGRLCASASGNPGHHDITPAYLGDDRIAFTSTRPRGLVPCFNSTVDTLHVMDPDGGNLRSISVNNVNEFDPAAMPDGRILYGRWEYVDKTALYMQSLWTIHPDGRGETAFWANNLARPTAVLDARPVPGTEGRLVAASLTPHNGQAVGAIAVIDAEYMKNSLSTVTNFTPEYPPAMDQGLTVAPSDPWPLSKDDVLISNNAIGGHGIIELIDRRGHRELVHCDAAVSCYAPMLVKPRPRPGVVARQARPFDSAEPGRFALLDVYQGLPGVRRGEVKFLRVIEETSRSSGLPPGGRWWNQAFLISWQGGYTVKNYLGVVPVEPDGSAYFEAPPAKALYFQALDAEGRQLQSMRTFVQAAGGVTRSCIGCHEYKHGAPPRNGRVARAFRRPASKPADESWGSGYLDYPTRVQPILDKHCVRCHGGADGISGGLDLSGGWTWAFNISYETFLKNTLVGFLNCNNGSVHTSRILPPRRIGSGSAPLAKALVSGHKGRVPKLTRGERDLIFAWMDGNSCYYGTWNYTPQATCRAILDTGGQLAAAMRRAGCMKCHPARPIGNDWINLRTPERSRILRAPLATGRDGLGLAWCRDRKAPAGLPLVTQRNQPPDVFRPRRYPQPDPKGKVHVSFASTKDAHYQAMLAIIRRGRAAALARPRVDMPGAEITPGISRQQMSIPLPAAPPALAASLTRDGDVRLQWTGSGCMIGLTFEIHRDGRADFAPTQATRIGSTPWFAFTDRQAPPGEQHYALVMVSGPERSDPIRASVTVPRPPPPPAPTGLTAAPGPGEIALHWNAVPGSGVRYDVYRAEAGSRELRKITDQPIAQPSFVDSPLGRKIEYTYVVRAVDRRGQVGPASDAATATAMAYIKEPMFVAALSKDLGGGLYGGGKLKGRAHGTAKVGAGALDLSQGGFVTFPHHGHFDIRKSLTIECWVRIDKPAQMPVILACGSFNQTGWFVQWYAGKWRWHVGAVSCDGGRPAPGKWEHVVGTYNGRVAQLYQNGRRVASTPCAPNLEVWRGPLVIGQYSQQQPSFQVFGRIGGVKIYRRALSAQEAAGGFKLGPPG